MERNYNEIGRLFSGFNEKDWEYSDPNVFCPVTYMGLEILIFTLKENPFILPWSEILKVLAQPPEQILSSFMVMTISHKYFFHLTSGF